MGHERVGFLPKSKSWSQVVEYIPNYSETSPDVSKITEYTLKNIRQKFLTLNSDASFLASFKCLVLLSYANREKKPLEFLDQNGIDIDPKGSLFQLTSATQKWMEKQEGSKEYNTLATKALVDTINHWVKAIPRFSQFFRYDSCTSDPQHTRLKAVGKLNTLIILNVNMTIFLVMIIETCQVEFLYI